MDATNPQNPTAEQVQAWTEQHGPLKVAEVSDRKVYFKKPTRQLVSVANRTLVSTKDPMQYADIFLKNCQLNYVEDTAADDELYFALTGIVDGLITSEVASLKNC